MLGFRVWDSELRRIFTFETVDVFNMSMYGSLRFWDDGGLCEASDRFIPMQSTGLKDCNDKEIYESDILLAEFSYLPSKYIKVESACFFWKWLGMIQPNDYKLTVLGNRFENPELLEKIK